MNEARKLIEVATETVYLATANLDSPRRDVSIAQVDATVAKAMALIAIARYLDHILVAGLPVQTTS